MVKLVISGPCFREKSGVAGCLIDLHKKPVAWKHITPIVYVPIKFYSRYRVSFYPKGAWIVILLIRYSFIACWLNKGIFKRCNSTRYISLVHYRIFFLFSLFPRCLFEVDNAQIAILIAGTILRINSIFYPQPSLLSRWFMHVSYLARCGCLPSQNLTLPYWLGQGWHLVSQNTILQLFTNFSIFLYFELKSELDTF